MAIVFVRNERKSVLSLWGVAESWDNFAQFGTNFQWFQPPIHPAFMQRQKLKRVWGVAALLVLVNCN
ncbi:MAG: hypothetical protein V7K54_06490 [Nostoc sp.]